MDERTQKQRRNLLLYSVAILILSHGDVSVNTINLPTISIKLNNPEALYAILWIAYGYAFLRYCQHLIAYERDGIIDAYGKCLDRYCVPEIKALLPEAKYIGTPPEYASVKNLFVYRILRLEQHVVKKVDVMSVDDSIHIQWKKIFIPVLKGTFAWIVKYPYFTDHLLPILVAGFALSTSIFSSWNGSIASIVSG